MHRKLEEKKKRQLLEVKDGHKQEDINKKYKNNLPI